jgi:hypothetical protein
MTYTESKDGHIKNKLLAMQIARDELFRATPKEVWRMYMENGYRLIEAIDEELSCTETMTRERWTGDIDLFTGEDQP